MTFGDCEEMCHIFDDCDFGDRDGCQLVCITELQVSQ